MKIEVLCRDGSPLGVSEATIFGKDGQVGCGGAELALLTMCKGWHDRGDEVVLYNNPRQRNGSCFEQRNLDEFVPSGDRDILIVFRSPNPAAYKAKGLKCWWSCDQYTIGDFRDFSARVEKIVTISPFHSSYFENIYGIKNSIPINLPVRTWEYEQKIEKVPNRLIFTSVPDRGLAVVAQTFPKIKERIPDATLVVLSDYRLWGNSSPSNSHYVQMFMRMSGVEFLGAVPRERLVQEQLKAQIHYYPCIYDELFCIAVAESQVAGVLPITSDAGALKTTNQGVVISGDARNEWSKNAFIETTIGYLENPDLPIHQGSLAGITGRIFSLDQILKEWDERVFNG